jgi:hypothetical protein
MAFAPHYLLGKVLGEFIEKEHGKYFDYAERDEDEVLAWAGDYPHKVYVGGPVGGSVWRPALVKKTVALALWVEAFGVRPLLKKPLLTLSSMNTMMERPSSRNGS